MHEAKQWSKATRQKSRKNVSGVHLYIPDNILRMALKDAGIDESCGNLEVRAYATKGAKGTARIILKVCQGP